jgi:hypothetical protein
MYFLVPDGRLAEQIVRDLGAEGVKDEDIGVLADSSALTDGLPDADITETSDVKPALKQGAVLGGATGLLAGLAATVVPGGFAVGGAALAGMALAGSAFGAWASSLIGISVPNREVARLQEAVEAGEILMIVNPVDLNRDAVKRIVSDHHPSVVYGGESDNVRKVHGRSDP